MPKKIFDAQIWIKVGLDALKAEGLNQFSVEALARKVGVTKGSFYWHFKDKEDYFKRVVDYWQQNQLLIIHSFSNKPSADPCEQLWRVMQFMLEKNSSDDIAMRSWVKHYAYATKAVKKVDKMRLQYLQGLFKDIGFNRQNAILRAQMLYHYQVGEHTILVRGSERERVNLNKLHYKLLIAAV